MEEFKGNPYEVFQQKEGNGSKEVRCTEEDEFFQDENGFF
jgi:hypothetical protein